MLSHFLEKCNNKKCLVMLHAQIFLCYIFRKIIRIFRIWLKKFCVSISWEWVLISFLAIILQSDLCVTVCLLTNHWKLIGFILHLSDAEETFGGFRLSIKERIKLKKNFWDKIKKIRRVANLSLERLRLGNSINFSNTR